MPPIDPLAAGSERAALVPPAPAPAAPANAAASPPRGARSGLAETAAVSLTQVGLVGRAMMDPAPPPAAPRQDAARTAAVPAAGAPRRVERVLEPWGIAMLPDDAALRTRREARDAASEAAKPAEEAEAEEAEHAPRPAAAGGGGPAD